MARSFWNDPSHRGFMAGLAKFVKTPAQTKPLRFKKGDTYESRLKKKQRQNKRLAKLGITGDWIADARREDALKKMLGKGSKTSALKKAWATRRKLYGKSGKGKRGGKKRK